MVLIRQHYDKWEAHAPEKRKARHPAIQSSAQAVVVVRACRVRNARPAAWIQILVIDFSPLRRREVSLQDLANGLTTGDLAKLTQEMCQLQLELIAEAEDDDVVFVPDDPEANDTFAARPEDVGLSWTLGHVVVHTTASSEESAALALVLARGLPVEGRSRYEVSWEQATTVEFLRRRIQESLRMRLSMLNAWPDSPHLDNFYTPYPGRPPMNAFGRYLGGLAHDDSHLDQIRKLVAQGKQRRWMAPNR
jgi:hypothetical protein